MDISGIGTLHAVLPELFLAISAMVLLMYGVFKGDRVTHAVTSGAVLSLLFALYLISIIDVGEPHSFADMFIHDEFTRFGKLLIILASIITLILAEQWIMEEENKRFEFPVIFLFSVIGLMLMVSASDLLAFYVGLELSSLSLYVLAAFRRDDLKSTEAGLKYFVLGSLASGMMLFGMSLIYGFAGTIEFDELARVGWAMMAGAQHVEHSLNPGLVSHGLVIGLVLLIVGFCFKISAVPFHMWTPDVYEGSPTPVTAYFAMAPKMAMLFLMMRVLNDTFPALSLYWQQIIAMVAAASMVIGALGALWQTNIKRLLAFSSIGHVGYILVGIAAGNQQGISAVIIYLSLYLFMTAGMFGCVLMMRRHNQPVEDIASLAGLSRTHPKMALAIAVFMFSMAGIPPLAGFFGKLYVFLAAVEAGMYNLAVLGVLSSVVACFYYLKIVKIMYFDEGENSFDKPETKGLPFVVGISAAVIVAFVAHPSLLTQSATLAAKALL